MGEYIKQFLLKTGRTIGSEEHKLVAEFSSFLEGKQKEQDAIDLLKSEGYTVIAPTPQPEAV